MKSKKCVTYLLLITLGCFSESSYSQSLEELRKTVQEKSEEALAVYLIHSNSRMLMLDIDQSFFDRKSPINILNMYDGIIKTRKSFLQSMQTLSGKFAEPVTDYQDLRGKLMTLKSIAAVATSEQGTLGNQVGSMLVYLSSMEHEYEHKIQDYQQLMDRAAAIEDIGNFTKTFHAQLNRRLDLIKLMKNELSFADRSLAIAIDDMTQAMQTILRSNFDEDLLKELNKISKKIEHIFFVNDLIFEVINAQQKLKSKAHAAFYRYADLEATQRSVTSAESEANLLAARIHAFLGVKEEIIAVPLAELQKLERNIAYYRKILEESTWEKMRAFQMAMINEALNAKAMTPECEKRGRDYIKLSNQMRDYSFYQKALPRFYNYVDQCIWVKK